jgi:hypothetical protein
MPVKKTAALHGTYTMYCRFTEDRVPTQVDWEQTFVCLNHKIIKFENLKFTFKVWPSKHVTTKNFRYEGDPTITYTQYVYLEFDCECPRDTTREDFPEDETEFKDEIQKHLIGWKVLTLGLGDLA